MKAGKLVECADGYLFLTWIYVFTSEVERSVRSVTVLCDDVNMGFENRWLRVSRVRLSPG